MRRNSHQTPEAKAKIAQAMRGRKNPMHGRAMPEGQRRNVSRVMKSCWADPAWRARWQSARHGKNRGGSDQ